MTVSLTIKDATAADLLSALQAAIPAPTPEDPPTPEPTYLEARVSALEASWLANSGNFAIHVTPSDASADLQSALDLAATNGTPVRLPAGDIWVKDVTLTAPLIGALGSTRIKLLPGSTRLFTGAAGTGPLVLRDLVLDGDGHTERALLSEENVGVRLENVDFLNWGEFIALFEQGTRDVAITGGCIRNSGGENCHLFMGMINRVKGVHFEDIYAHAVRFGRPPAYADIDSGHYSVVEGCTFVNVGNDAVLFEIDSRWGTVTNNVGVGIRSLIKIQSSDTLGPASRVVVSDNVVNSQKPAASDGSRGACIKAEPGVVGLVATGNIIRGFEHGISLGPQGTATGNVIEAATGYGVIAGGSDTVISGNVIGGTGTAVRVLATNVTVVNNNLRNASGKISGTPSVNTGNLA